MYLGFADFAWSDSHKDQSLVISQVLSPNWSARYFLNIYLVYFCKQEKIAKEQRPCPRSALHLTFIFCAPRGRDVTHLMPFVYSFPLLRQKSSNRRVSWFYHDQSKLIWFLFQPVDFKRKKTPFSQDIFSGLKLWQSLSRHTDSFSLVSLFLYSFLLCS